MSSDHHCDITTWLDAAGRFPLLPAERVTLIARQIQELPEGSAKRRKLVNTLVNHNLRLVVRFVKGFLAGRSHNKWGCPETVDYLQIGVIGLVRAAEKYDPARGYAFSTYANHWIRSTVSRYNLKTTTPVSISESAARELIFFKRNGYFKGRNGEVRSQQRGAQIKGELEMAYACRSLNAPLDGGGEFQDLVPDRTNRLDMGAFHEALGEAMDRAGISPMGKEILVSYYVNEEKPTDTAEKLGISIHKYKTEKAKAISCARSCPELFESGTL